jgi:uncharacterized protein (DUF2252 family)
MTPQKKSESQSDPGHCSRRGKELRKTVPRESHAEWSPSEDRVDPVNLLQEQDASRVRHLVPIKYGRMMESAFAFYRGSAALMTADLASTPTTGLQTMLCGDAHLSNFGIFASPERRMIFDINDFDEAYPGPWEWDLKRLAASAVIAGRDNGFKAKKCRRLAVATVNAYRDAMRRFSELSTLDVWYFHVPTSAVLRAFEDQAKHVRRSARKTVDKASRKTQARTLAKMTHLEDGRLRIKSDPPLLVPVAELDLTTLEIEGDETVFKSEAIYGGWRDYVDSLPDDRKSLLSRYQPIDCALRVGGVGSVGTRCAIMLLQGEGPDDAVLLQLKEAGTSVLESYLPRVSHASQGERVVIGQRLMQAVSDIFLGWHTSHASGVEYYWRQFKDLKGSVDIGGLDEQALSTYLKVCAICLARAHARTGDAAAIGGYIGKSDALSEAIADFSVTYAEQAEDDYQALVQAVKESRVEAQTGI